jgi:hypothetical protein
MRIQRVYVPACDRAIKHVDAVLEDPMSKHAPIDEIIEGWMSRHVDQCEVCKQASAEAGMP